MINRFVSWAVERAGETSTKLGAIGGTVAAPTIIDDLRKAYVFFEAGDYVSCSLYFIPALIGIIGAIGAIVTKDD